MAAQQRGKVPRVQGELWASPEDTLGSRHPSETWLGYSARSLTHFLLLAAGSITAGKPVSQDRKITPTSRELTNSKSPHAPVPDHHHPISPYEHLLRGVSGVDLYRGHIPLAFDPAAIPRGIQLEAGTVGRGDSCLGTVLQNLRLCHAKALL